MSKYEQKKLRRDTFLHEQQIIAAVNTIQCKIRILWKKKLVYVEKKEKKGNRRDRGSV